MSARVSDYVKAIQKMKLEAGNQNKTELIIRAGDLHSQVNKGTPTLVTCCMAMKKMMLEDDEFLKNPENKSGASANLTIKYQLHDLEHRLPLLRPKQRGRKKGVQMKRKKKQKAVFR